MNSKQLDARMGVRDCLCWSSGTKIALEGDTLELPLDVGSLETLKCDGDPSGGRESSVDVSDHVFVNCDGHMTPVKQETKSDGLKVKKQQRRRLKIDENPEAIMVDIMRYKYGNDYARRKMLEKEKETKKKQEEEEFRRQFCTSANHRSNVKGNKAAQLRCIALSDRIESKPDELWKIERFTKNVVPHISTKGIDRNVELRKNMYEDKDGGRPVSGASENWSSCRVLYVGDEESEIDFPCTPGSHLE